MEHQRGFLARLVAPSPFIWSDRNSGIVIFFMLLGVVVFGFGLASALGFAGPAVEWGHVALAMAIGVYEVTLGLVALREHHAQTGDLDRRRARAHAAMFGLLLPVMAGLSLLCLYGVCRPFPPTAPAFAVPVEDYSERTVTDHVVLFRLQLRGLDEPLQYLCRYEAGRGWCSGAQALSDATYTPPRQVDIKPTGDGKATVRLGGAEIPNWDMGAWRHRKWSLIFGLAAGGLFALWLLRSLQWAWIAHSPGRRQ